MKDWDGFIDFKESNAGQYYEMYDDFGIEEMKSVRKLIYDTYGNEPNYILVRYEIKGVMLNDIHQMLVRGWCSTRKSEIR